MEQFMTIVLVTEVLRCLAGLMVLYYAYQIYQGQKELTRFLEGSKDANFERTMENSAISTLKTTRVKSDAQ